MIIPVCTHAHDPHAVLPALAAAGSEVRRVALRPAATRELSDADTVIVDARDDLHTARRLCVALLARPRLAVVVVVDEGGLITLGPQLAPAQFLLPGTGPAEIRARLALARSRTRVGARRERASRMGSLTLERERRRAVVDGRDLRLSEREFAVLATLASCTGKVVGRRELLERAWGSRWFAPGAVDPVVRRLRAELGGDAVEAVRGVGYRLRTECLFR